MVDDMSLGTFIRASIMVSAEVDIYFPILELLSGQGQRMTAAIAEQQSPKQVLSPHPGRTLSARMGRENLFRFFNDCHERLMTLTKAFSVEKLSSLLLLFFSIISRQQQ